MPEPTAAEIEHAADVLRRGGLVAFPTETVYGLGADARNEAAVRRIFDIKRRPPTQALSVLLGHDARVDDWADDVSNEARALIRTFWPGALTVIVRRRPGVPDLVTAGGDTVGLRVPNQPVALQLLRRFAGGIAAPSANRHGSMSPTTAAAVRAELGDDVEVVLDGGACELGIESTIVDCSRGQPRVIRFGAIALDEIERAVGPVRVAGIDDRGTRSRNAPKVRVELADEASVGERARIRTERGDRVGVLALGPPSGVPGGVVLSTPASIDEYARTLYQRLRDAEDAGLDVLLAVPPPEEGIGAAVADRLRRAATASEPDGVSS